MTRPRIVFCYRYGLLGGVSAQLLNRYPAMSQFFDVTVVYEQDYGMASRFPAGAAVVAPTQRDREAALAQANADIVVVIDSPSFIDAWRTAGKPGRLVLEVHTTTANVSYLRDRDQFADVSHIITVSQYMDELLRSHRMQEIAPISIVPNCLDDMWRQPTVPTIMDGHPLVWVGKLDSHKRWRTAVDLMDQVAEGERDGLIPMLVGGLTSPVAEVAALTTRLATSTGLANAVWWPRVEYDRMPALYTSVAASGGVHICTSINESFGMAVAESVVRGCPVIAPAVGALPEILPAAALYEAEDFGAAREKVRRALHDQAFRAELLSTADRLRELTVPGRAAELYAQIVEKILGSPVPSR
ncbi:glycosyltransferase involved in cell wall biosynthesis [Hamadaea flava]|uniref:Glycosyltransferase family 4 protein n=1 Tax=Hamadaea flava TaxID=1742688 RepID=A0ABV8LUQ5_9ACTN|nr:glycosyltransferase family 4 protein [Hamadaea flava]MCP2327380.1 glycosyltransferase involved in cell wall biosynthesis [Hamadaea flava]